MTLRAEADPPWPSAARGWWAVAVLTFAYIVSFVDRAIIGLLIEPIKADFALTDVQIALLQGAAFAIFYALMGVPMGWLADRISRRGLISAGVTVWCLATAACGMAGNFVQLFLARLGVGAGEAALSPAAMSMISDLFPRERRGLPIGVYTMAAALGFGLAMILGGAVIHLIAEAQSLSLPLFGEVRSWQAAFIIVGLAGLILLPLFATVLEPHRRGTLTAAGTATPARSGMVAFLLAERSFYLPLYSSIALFAIVGYAMLNWVPAMFMRSFGWTAPETGFRFGMILLTFGALGTVVGGWVAARLHARNIAGAPVVVAGIAIAGYMPFAIGGGLATNPWLALALLGPALLFLTAPNGAALQALQEATPGEFRGRASSLHYVFTSIVGLTLGPLSVAVFTDHVFNDPKSIGLAIAIVTAVLTLPSIALIFVSRPAFIRLADRE
jgi:MFS family permease